MVHENSPNGTDVPDNGSPYWMRNLIVCVWGSFTTIVSMTLLLPFLPVYIEQLGEKDHAGIAEWSGIAYGATFFVAAFAAPMWGKVADLYGRKLMLIRASLGMAVVMSLMGVAHHVWQLVALRLLTGLLGGYSSGSTLLVATQTPKSQTGWALGILSSGIMAGSIVGPWIGGILPPLIGIPATFMASAAVIFISFLTTILFIKEEPRPIKINSDKQMSNWRLIPDKRPLIAMLITGILLMLANMSIEPIITLYVAQFVAVGKVTFYAGIVMSAAAFGSVISSSWLGKLADRVGHWNIIIYCLAVSALLLIPQAFVTEIWQLVVMRFLMGLALGGLMPCISSVIRHNVPEKMVGQMLGYSISSQFIGQVVGPVAGGFIGGHFGMQAVFFGTCMLMAGGAVFNKAIHSAAVRESGL